MDILEGAMAFSVVMIVLATVVTGITEAYLRGISRRQKMLALAMEQMLLELAPEGGKGLLCGLDGPQIAEIWPDHTMEDWPCLMVDDLTYNMSLGKLMDLRLPWYKRWARASYRRAMMLWQGFWYTDPSQAPSWQLPGYPDRRISQRVAGSLVAEETRPVKQDTFDGTRGALVQFGLACLAWFVTTYAWRRMAHRWRALWSARGQRLRNHRRIDDLTLRGFAERLARSPAFDIMMPTPNRRTMTEVVARYGRYKALTSERYRKYAQASSIWIALVVALVFNIDAGRIFLYVMTDDAARTALVEKAPEIVTQINALNDRIRALGGAVGDEGASIDEAGLTATAKAQLARLRNDLEELQAIQSEAMAVLADEHGIPIGYDYFPHCHLRPVFAQLNVDQGAIVAALTRFDWPGEELARVWAGAPVVEDPCKLSDGETQNGTVWALNAVIAGFLIGLGGPFWYKVFNGLSRLSQMLGRKKTELMGGETVDAGEEKPATVDEEIAKAVQSAMVIWVQRGKLDEAELAKGAATS